MFKEKLVSLRKQKGVTQEDLAKILHCSKNAVGKYERGESEPDIHSLIVLSNYFGVSIDYLVDHSNKPEFEPYEIDILKEAILILRKYFDKHEDQ